MNTLTGNCNLLSWHGIHADNFTLSIGLNSAVNTKVTLLVHHSPRPISNVNVSMNGMVS